jgi:hypothetical protein
MRRINPLFRLALLAVITIVLAGCTPGLYSWSIPVTDTDNSGLVNSTVPPHYGDDDKAPIVVTPPWEDDTPITTPVEPPIPVEPPDDEEIEPPVIVPGPPLLPPGPPFNPPGPPVIPGPIDPVEPVDPEVPTDPTDPDPGDPYAGCKRVDLPANAAPGGMWKCPGERPIFDNSPGQGRRP